MAARRSLVMLEITWNDSDQEGTPWPEPEEWRFDSLMRTDDPESPVRAVRVMKVEDISPGGTPL